MDVVLHAVLCVVFLPEDVDSGTLDLACDVTSGCRSIWDDAVILLVSMLLSWYLLEASAKRSRLSGVTETASAMTG